MRDPVTYFPNCPVTSYQARGSVDLRDGVEWRGQKLSRVFIEMMIKDRHSNDTEVEYHSTQHHNLEKFCRYLIDFTGIKEQVDSLDSARLI